MEETWMEHLTVLMKNKKREERLHHRVSVLEEENKKLKQEIKRMALQQKETCRKIECMLPR